VHHYYHRLKKSYVLQDTQKRMLKTCHGDNQKGHFPPKFSVKIAVIRSSEPKIARWIITGIWDCWFSLKKLHTDTDCLKALLLLGHKLVIVKVEALRELEIELDCGTLV
jgi:hypothetical protein